MKKLDPSFIVEKQGISMQKTFDKNSVLERRGKNVNPADDERDRKSVV